MNFAQSLRIFAEADIGPDLDLRRAYALLSYFGLTYTPAAHGGVFLNG